LIAPGYPTLLEELQRLKAAQGREGLKTLLEIIAKGADERLPADARASLIVLAAQLSQQKIARAVLHQPALLCERVRWLLF
jgi:hypothetical protein